MRVGAVIGKALDPVLFTFVGGDALRLHPTDQIRVGQVGEAVRVASTNLTLDEMALQNVTSRECVCAKGTFVWPIASICFGLVRRRRQRSGNGQRHEREDTYV